MVVKISHLVMTSGLFEAVRAQIIVDAIVDICKYSCRFARRILFQTAPVVPQVVERGFHDMEQHLGMSKTLSGHTGAAQLYRPQHSHDHRSIAPAERRGRELQHVLVQVLVSNVHELSLGDNKQVWIHDCLTGIVRKCFRKLEVTRSECRSSCVHRLRHITLHYWSP